MDKGGLRRGFHDRLWFKGRNTVGFSLPSSVVGVRAKSFKVIRIMVVEVKISVTGVARMHPNK